MISPSVTLGRSDIEARIERIDALVRGARRLIAEDKTLDLAVLAFAFADLRDAVRAAPAAATSGLAGRLSALQAALDGLLADLDAAAGAGREAIAQRRRRAFKAYGDDGRG